MKKVGIFGSTGRVGELLIKNLKNHNSLELATLHAIEEFNFTIDENLLVTNDIATLLEKSDVVIDFSLPNGTEALLEEAIKNPTALVIGTTGLNQHQLNLLEEASNENYVPAMIELGLNYYRGRYTEINEA